MDLIRRQRTLDPGLVYSPLDPNHVQACLNGPRYGRQIIIIKFELRVIKLYVANVEVIY